MFNDAHIPLCSNGIAKPHQHYQKVYAYFTITIPKSAHTKYLKYLSLYYNYIIVVGEVQRPN